MRISIFCQQLEYMGGIERVVLEHLRIFSAKGLSVELLVDRPISLMKEKVFCPWTLLPSNSKERKDVLENYLKTKRPDLLIFHGVSHEHSVQDVTIAKKNDIKSVCVIHFPFVSNLALDGGKYNSWYEFYSKGSDCTAFATVSAIDAVFWRGLGKKSFHVQNPFVHPSMNVEMSRRGGEDGTSNLLWVGRLCEPKQPKSALAAFAQAVKACPNITLTMVGGDVKGIKALQKEARRLGVLEKVEFVPERPDINEYWAKADIHLLTSICESFCLVWAEAKAAGIPTIMFELPYLELAEDKRGYIAVEQRNIKALADAIVKVVNDGNLRLSMGKDAKESLSPFNDEAVWQSWARVFEGVKDPEAGLDVDINLKTIVSQMYMAVCYDKEAHRWPEEMAENWQRLTRTSMRPIARGFECLVDTVRKIKAKIRG